MVGCRKQLPDQILVKAMSSTVGWNVRTAAYVVAVVLLVGGVIGGLMGTVVKEAEATNGETATAPEAQTAGGPNWEFLAVALGAGLVILGLYTVTLGTSWVGASQLALPSVSMVLFDPGINLRTLAVPAATFVLIGLLAAITIRRESYTSRGHTGPSPLLAWETDADARRLGRFRVGGILLASAFAITALGLWVAPALLGIAPLAEILVESFLPGLVFGAVVVALGLGTRRLVTSWVGAFLLLISLAAGAVTRPTPFLGAIASAAGVLALVAVVAVVQLLLWRRVRGEGPSADTPGSPG